MVLEGVLLTRRPMRQHGPELYLKVGVWKGRGWGEGHPGRVHDESTVVG